MKRATQNLFNASVFLLVALLLNSCKDKEMPAGSVFGTILDDVPDYILYVSNRKGGPIHQAMNELYFVNVESGEELQLTNTSTHESVVKFVYNRVIKKIVFTSVIRYAGSQAGLDIFSMDLQTRVITNLTNSKEKLSNGTYNIDEMPIHSDPEISPDGSSIVYVRMYPQLWEINIIPLDGREEYTLLSTTYDNYCWKPRWSPDGTKLLYTAKSNNNWHVMMMNADGSDKKSLSDRTYSELATWSPDGSHILYLAGTSQPSFFLDLYTADATGNNPAKITGGGVTSIPCWSRSGNFIVYKAGPISEGTGDIHVIDREGTMDQKITDLDGEFYGISWSYNDDKLLFSYSNAGIREVFMMTKDGSKIQQITDTGYSSKPQWIDINLLQ